MLYVTIKILFSSNYSKYRSKCHFFLSSTVHYKGHLGIYVILYKYLFVYVRINQIFNNNYLPEFKNLNSVNINSIISQRMFKLSIKVKL